MAKPIVSISGLRGIVWSELTPEVLAKYVSAVVSELIDNHPKFQTDSGAPRVIVGRDGRRSGEVIFGIVSEVLGASGCEVLNAGIVPTPTIGVLVRQYGADCAIQITASHNPAEYNGLKVFDSSGRVLNQELANRIIKIFDGDFVYWTGRQASSFKLKIIDTASNHLHAVLSTVNAERIRKKRFRVLLDSNSGAGGHLGEKLLESLRCSTIPIDSFPNGDFTHKPEPIAENLGAVASQVAKYACDIGFCQDPDADRLALIDERGRYVGEECTLALCIKRILLLHPTSRRPVVTNCATSCKSEILASKTGSPFHRSSVGEANVVDCMIAVGAIFGGEGNGGPIDPRVGYVRDSFVGMAQILDLMALTNLPLSSLCDSLPSYAMIKSKFSLNPSKLKDALEKIADLYPTAIHDWQDGLRIVWKDSWLLLRGSNTEPVVRIITEAPCQERANELCRSVLAALQTL